MSAPSLVRIMTVCTGNICRSPMAEIVLRDRFATAGLAGRVVVDSTGVSSEEAGNAIDRRARDALVARGYQVDGMHRARQVRPAQLAERDLVLPMTAQHARRLRQIAPRAAGATWDRIKMYRSFDPAVAVVNERDEYLLDVADPWYGGASDFEICLDEIEAAAGGIVEAVLRQLD